MATSPFSTLAGSIASSFGASTSTINQVSQLGGILGGVYASSQLSAAGDIAAQGGALSASAYRQSGDTAVEFAKYNSQIISANLSQQLSDLSMQQKALMSTQRVQMAVSGVNMGSQSFLAVASASIDSFARREQSLRLAAAVQTQGTLFQGTLSQIESENRARLAKYQGEVQQAQYEQQRDEQDLMNIANLASFFL